MMMLLTLAWRNLRRQKRRTLITSSAIALALFLAIMTRAFQEGSYQFNINNAARFYTGLIQIQHPNYADSASIDDLLPQSKHFISPTNSMTNINYILPRIESVALAAAGQRSKGAFVIGVEPNLERNYSNIAEKLVDGVFLTSDSTGVLIGQGLADYLQVSVGDEIVLYGQGYHGQTASGLYPITGILNFPVAALDNQLVYMPLKLAQNLYSTQQQVSYWLLHIDNLKELSPTIEQLTLAYHDSATVKGWYELSPDMAQQIKMDRISGIFLIYILYGIVGFGLFATILMMTLERQREFAVMLATGLLRRRLLILVMIESFILAILGIIIGFILAIPLLGYFHFNPLKISGEAAQLMLESGFQPILPVLINPALFIDQLIAISILLLVCLIYPLFRIYRLELVAALKGGAHAH
jgi:ABC-type lipoprotein release transport system permease subunit